MHGRLVANGPRRPKLGRKPVLLSMSSTLTGIPFAAQVMGFPRRANRWRRKIGVRLACSRHVIQFHRDVPELSQPAAPVGDMVAVGSNAYFTLNMGSRGVSHEQARARLGSAAWIGYRQSRNRGGYAAEGASTCTVRFRLGRLVYRLRNRREME